VLFRSKDLPRLIPLHRITGIIITAALSPELRAAVQELACKHGVVLSEWGFRERDLVGPPVEPASAAGAGAQPVLAKRPAPDQTVSTAAKTKK
jgi:hypothetical protein